MNTYWHRITDKEKLLDALKKQRDLYTREMTPLRTQSRIYQNFHDSKVDALLSGNEYGIQDRSVLQKRFAYNIIGVVTEAILGRVSKLKPKPSFISNSYLYSMKSKIKRLDVQTLSNMKKQDLYNKSDICLANGYIQNIGIMKTSPGDEEVLYFPVEIEDFFVHKPYTGHRKKIIAGDKTKMNLVTIYETIYPNLKKEYKEDFLKKNNIEDIEEKLNDGTFEDKEVELHDFYFIDENMKNSRRVVWTEKSILVDEKWDYDFLPYDFVSYKPPQKGIVGVGISEILTPLQQRLNTLLKKISRSLDISFYPIILAHIHTRVKRKFTDEAAQVIEWEGATPPTQMVQAVTHPQAFQHFDHLIHMMYRSVRQDETSVATSVPENADKASGVAIKNLETTEQGKIYQSSKLFESFIISISKKTARYIIKENYNNISEVIEDDKEFFKNVNTWPVSLFPSTPEGKFQRAEFLIQAGLMTPEEIADLYDFPELAGSTLAQKGSKISAIYSKIENAISKDGPLAPDPILGYDRQLEIAEGIYGKLLIEEEKYEKQIKKIRTFIGICSTALKREQMKILQEQMALQQALNPIPTSPSPAPAAPSPQGAGLSPAA